MKITDEQISAMVKKFLENGLHYDPDHVEIESIKEHADGCYILDLTMSEGPRCAAEFISAADSEYTIDVTTTFTTHDNGPSDISMRNGFIIDQTNRDDEDYEQFLQAFEGLEFGSLSFFIAGNISAPDYCDDESDAYFTGSVFLQIDGKDWAEERSKEYCLDDIEKSTEILAGGLIGLISELRSLGHKKPICIKEAHKILRNSLMP